MTVKQFFVVGTDQGKKVYYGGWWEMYNQPIMSPYSTFARKMSRANANRVRRRLENPDIWGGEWAIEEVKPGDVLGTTIKHERV